MRPLIAAILAYSTITTPMNAPNAEMPMDLEVVEEALENRVEYAPEGEQFTLPVAPCLLLNPERERPQRYLRHGANTTNMGHYKIDQTVFLAVDGTQQHERYWVLSTDGKIWAVGYASFAGEKHMLFNSTGKGWDKRKRLEDMKWRDVPTWFFDTKRATYSDECGTGD